MKTEKIKDLAKRLLYPIPADLAKNLVNVDNEGLETIKESIKQNYHAAWRNQDNYSSQRLENDMKDHLYQRLEYDRRRIIPWLNNVKSLANTHILEIGCGTGSSTVAMAEQGAKVFGIDVDEGALAVAKDRCGVCGLKAEIRKLNATEISNEFAETSFDFIIFFASLEHMTIEERLTSLKSAWNMLKAGSFLVIIETPNRLWCIDGHTSQLPFFHWLPDELAFRYSRFSPRDNFRELYRQYDETSKQHFLRRGRGVSFHEIDIAIKPVSSLKKIRSLSGYEGFRYWLRQSRFKRRYKSLLKRIYPQIHEGFFNDSLDLAIEKI